MAMFDKSLKEFSGEKGCHRGKGLKVSPVPPKNFPSRFHPSTDRFYRVFDCPWAQKSADRPSVQGTKVYESKAKTKEGQLNDFPIMKVKEKQLKDWEEGDREQLAVLNFSDWYLASMKVVLDKCLTVLEEKGTIEGEDRNDMWNDLLEVLSLTDSITKCNQDCTKLAVERIASLVITRRDSWIDRFSSDIDGSLKLQMRHEDLNQSSLFSEESVDKAKRMVKEETTERRQESLLEQAAFVLKEKSSRGGGAPKGVVRRDQGNRVGRSYTDDFRAQQQQQQQQQHQGGDRKSVV